MSYEKRYAVEPLPTPPEAGAVPGKCVSCRSMDSNFFRPSMTESYEAKEIESEDPSVTSDNMITGKQSTAWEEELNLDLDTVDENQSEGTTADVANIESVMEQLRQGIKESLQTFKKPNRDLLMTDFSTNEEIAFSRKGPNFADSNFLLRIYAPVAFTYFRALFGITTDDFIKSVCGNPLYSTKCKGNSGSKFYLTSDDRYILKTVQNQEANFLIRLFPGYFLNLTQHTKTLLPKYYGLYSHETPTKVTRLLIMNNILPRIYNFHEKYDLKGSTYSKRKWQNKNSTDEKSAIKVTLKDLNFLEKWPEGFYLNNAIYRILMNSIERDCKVLESYRIMDYSLLLGIVYPDKPDSAKVSNFKAVKSSENLKRNKNLIGPFEAVTETGTTIYLFLGIIDILQSYNWNKKIESFVKSIFYSRSSVSVNSPDFYSQRFQNFLRSNVFKGIPNLIPSSKKEPSVTSLQMLAEEEN